MCQYYSFCVDVLDPRIVYVADGYSHSGVESLFGVKPDSYRECEWTGDTPETLIVRGLTANESRILRETILARWATRGALVSLVAPARAAYNKAVAMADTAYDKAVAPADAAYDKAVAPADAAYDKAVAPARAAYNKAVATARAAYNKAVAMADTAYDKAVAPARDAYREHFTKEA